MSGGCKCVTDDLKYYKYEGAYNKYNQRQGQGHTYYRNGDEYEGMYDNGKRHGYGVYKFNNGAVYEGQWYDGKKTGKGKFNYPDESYYDGMWYEDQRAGFGKYTYTNKDYYEGEWSHHVRHGEGKYLYQSTALVFIGRWTNGVRDAEGLIHRAEEVNWQAVDDKAHEVLHLIPGDFRTETDARKSWWRGSVEERFEPTVVEGWWQPEDSMTDLLKPDGEEVFLAEPPKESAPKEGGDTGDTAKPEA